MSAQETPKNDPSAPRPGELGEVEKQVLAFASLRWKYPGAMETAIREQFGWTATRFFQVLNHLLEQPEASAFDAHTVARLRRLREARQEQRRPHRDARN